ncbi:MAG: hypothetical protein E7661_04830 [Ruminococcaceae bacterium]|nr:hypothetical protein [Oscillospiraceae bacterium]
MNDKSFLMAEAMSYIDDRFLEEAHPEARGMTQEQVNKRKTLKQIALVACLCLVAIGVARLPSLNESASDMWVGNGAAPEANQPFGDIANDGASPDGNTGSSMAPGMSESLDSGESESCTAEETEDNT